MGGALVSFLPFLRAGSFFSFLHHPPSRRYLRVWKVHFVEFAQNVCVNAYVNGRGCCVDVRVSGMCGGSIPRLVHSDTSNYGLYFR
jgi:hypothetical protein